MKKIVIAAVAVLAMSSFAVAQQNQTPGASKAGTTQSPDENAKMKMQNGTTGQNSTPGSGSGSSIKSKSNEPQAVPPSNTTGGGAAK